MSTRLSGVAVSLLILSFSLVNQCWGEGESDDSSLPQAYPESVLESADLVRMKRLLMVVQRFQVIAQTNYRKALALYADEAVIADFDAFNEHIWIDTPPEIGWSFFMSVSVQTVGAVQGSRPLVAFYNPFSDVFLVTAWRTDEEIPRMTGAEVLMGDWIRADTSELSPVPAWLRSDLFKPAALGISIAETIKAFEKLYPVSVSSDDWRDKLPVTSNKQLLEGVNYPAVAVMLYNSLVDIDRFRTAEMADDPRMASCRIQTVETVRRAAQGEIEALAASAEGTLPEMQTLLTKPESSWFSGLEAVAIFSGNDGCLVLLSPMHRPVAALSLFYSETQAGLRLQRMDLVDYQGAYRNSPHGGMVTAEGGQL